MICDKYINTLFLALSLSNLPLLLSFNTRKHTSLTSCVFFQIPSNKNSKPPTIPFCIVKYTFSDNLPRNFCKPTELKFPTTLKNGRLVGLVPLFSTLNCSICLCYLRSLTYRGQQGYGYMLLWFNFILGSNFISLLFLGIVMYDNEFQTKENNI